MAKINLNSLASEITQALKEYTTEVEEGLEKAKQKRAREGAKKLRETSPKRTGAYAKSWTVKKVGTAQVIHARAPHYRLAHLLEKGYAKRGGGRVAGRPHIGPVEEEVIRNYESDVKKVIKG